MTITVNEEVARWARKAAATSSPAGLTTPTESLALTAAGAIVGTFQYMSPEQLQGKEADARSDIFALGAVLFEMLSGRRAFEGVTQAAVLGAILHADPPPQSLAGTEGGRTPFWSPDCRSLGFFPPGKLMRIDLSGGPPQVLADASAYGGTWNDEGVIVFTPTARSGLARVSANGGPAIPVTTLDVARGVTREVLATWRS